MKSLKITALAALAGVLSAGQVSAGPPMPPPEISMVPDSPWSFEFMPYGWLAGLEGTMAVGGVSTNVDLSPGDIVSELDMVAMANFAVRYNRIGFLTDFFYMRVSPSFGGPRPLFRDTSLIMKATMVDLKGSYRLYETEKAWLDILAGARYFQQDLSITLNAGLAPTQSGAGTEGWWDAVGGIRGQYNFTDKWFLTYMADVGGGSSEITWQAIGGVGYQFNDLVSATVGYRYMDYDYRNGDFAFDAEMDGFIIGVGFEW